MTRLTITTLLCTLFLGVLAAHAQEENKGIFPDKNLEKGMAKHKYQRIFIKTNRRSLHAMFGHFNRPLNRPILAINRIKLIMVVDDK